MHGHDGWFFFFFSFFLFFSLFGNLLVGGYAFFISGYSFCLHERDCLRFVSISYFWSFGQLR